MYLQLPTSNSAFLAASTTSLYRLLPDGSIDESSLPADVHKLIAQRISEELEKQASSVEAEVQTRVANARADIEAKTRHTVQLELKADVLASQAREVGWSYCLFIRVTWCARGLR